MDLELSDARSVFINCPFDSAYSPLFDAIVFTVVSCGFTPRSALETGSVGEPRLDKITRALFASRYSIHDLTRCTGEGADNFARFNMPLELGMAMAHGIVAPQRAKHEWLVLAPAGHSYARFVSDLSGFDPARHDGTVRGVVTQVLAWLRTRKLKTATPGPQQVLEALPQFEQALQILRSDWSPADPPWREVVLAAVANKPRQSN